MNIARQEILGIGLESGAGASDKKPEMRGGMDSGRGGPGMGMPPGGGPPGGGMAGGGPGGGPPSRGERPQPIELWTKVTLAHGPTAPGS